MPYNIDNWMAAWNTGGPVKVGPWPDRTGWSDDYEMTTGCCRSRQDGDRIALMFIDFHSLVVGYEVDPAEAHREFLKIKEYRRSISPDFPGAD